MNEEEGFEEWDADFLEQLIQVEELALSSAASIPNPNPNPTLFPSPQPPKPTTFSYLPQQYHNSFISYSPPRELSQRPIDFNKTAPPSTSLLLDTTKDQEIHRLKRELGRVSRQLTDLERECFELRKVKNKKEEQIRSVYSHAEETNVGVQCLKNSTLEYGVHTVDAYGVFQQSKNSNGAEDQIGIATSSYKAIGVQTEEAGDLSKIVLNDDLPSQFDLFEKLMGIWGSTSDQKLGRNLISKLFTTCSAEFHVLFGCMGINMSSRIPAHVVAGQNSSHAVLACDSHSLHSSEAVKASRLYSVLMKISNGLLPVEALFGALLDLCDLSNVAILCCSLHILHVFLRHLFSLGGKLEGRDNVMVEGLCSMKNIEDGGMFSVSKLAPSYTRYNQFMIESSDPHILCKKGSCYLDNAMLPSCIDWVSLFELMHKIAVKNIEERVTLEAVSVMKVILMRSNAYMEREKFGQRALFESIAQLFKKEAGLQVRKEALHLLHLLLNCPKLLVIFCSGCKEENADAANSKTNAPTLKPFRLILEGLADCIACCGNGIEGIELCKRAVIMLAFLASSGATGFEVLVTHKLPGEANFLMLIMQVLVSEMDIEVPVSAEPVESVKARTSLVREALILLNRLVSNPVYSAAVLRLLTASRDMASLTIDIASRLSRNDPKWGQSDSISRQMRESEIADLARVFKKRVFTYLGDKIL